jgi:hypothetical protein
MPDSLLTTPDTVAVVTWAFVFYVNTNPIRKVIISARVIFFIAIMSFLNCEIILFLFEA